MASKLTPFLKGLGKGEILVPHLDRWFKQDFTGHPDIPLVISPDKPGDDAFHPSGQAVGCSRLIYAALDPEVELKRRTFNPKVGINGHMWHALIQHIVVHELGFATEDDVEARRGIFAPIQSHLTPTLMPWHEPTRPPAALWWATGSIDINNLTVPGRDKKYLVDIKTMQPDSFKMPTPPKFLWNKYVAQCQLYMDWADVDTCILLGVEAGNPFKFKEILIERDPDHVMYVYAKWDSVSEAMRTGVAPPHSCLTPDECDSLSLYDQEGNRLTAQTTHS